MNADRIIGSIRNKFMIFGCLAIMLITATSNLNHTFENLLVHDSDHTAELVRDDSKGIAAGYNDLLELKKATWIDKVTGYGEAISMVSNKFGVHVPDIKVVMTDAEYASIYKLDIIKGVFLDSRAMDRGDSHAVVSGKLALKLFKTLDIIGNEIDLNGRKYIVTGVYKDKGYPLWDILGDGFDRIYIPYSSINGFEEKPVDVISLLGKSGFDMVSVKRFLENQLGSSLSSYKIIEYQVMSAAFHQFYDLFIFILGVLAVIFTLLFMVRFSLDIRGYFKKKAEILYYKEIFKTDIKNLIRYLMVIILCGISIVILLKFLPFRLIVADKYIPFDNIFDLRFYLEALLGDIREVNSYTGDVYSVIKLKYDHMTGINVICTFIITILMVAAIGFFNVLLISEATFFKIMRYLLIIVVAGGTLGTVLSIIAGFGIAIPVRALAVTLYFFVVCDANKKLSVNTIRSDEIAGVILHAKWHN